MLVRLRKFGRTRILRIGSVAVVYDVGLRGWIVKLIWRAGAGYIGGWTAFLGQHAYAWGLWNDYWRWAEYPLVVGATRNATHVPFVVH